MWYLFNVGARSYWVKAHNDHNAKCHATGGIELPKGFKGWRRIDRNEYQSIPAR